MPIIVITQAEKQRLESILRESLSQLDDELIHEKGWIREVAKLAKKFYWDYGVKKQYQDTAHKEIKKINGRIAKRVALLKKIKHPEQIVL